MTIEADTAALIFDLDGTLLDTEPLYSQAAQKVLDAYGVTYTEALKRRIMGGDAHVSAQIVIDEFGLPLTPDEYLALREEHLLKLFEGCPEIPGASAFLEALRGTDLACGLATSSHRYLCDIKLAGRPWANDFRALVCGDDPRLERGKPAPDIFLLCAEALGVPAEQCIVFEDSGNGIEAGLAAGMKVVAVNSVHVEPGALSQASCLIESFEEALAWLP